MIFTTFLASEELDILYIIQEKKKNVSGERGKSRINNFFIMTWADADAFLQHLMQVPLWEGKAKPTYREMKWSVSTHQWHNAKHAADKPAVAFK